MRIVIIEDEPLAAKDLEALIRKNAPDASILAILTSVEAAKKWFSGNPCPDLILSDIQLSDGVSFEIYENNIVNCPVIFTTAYDDYAIRAFKINSIDYLLKPVDPHELSAAIQKYRQLVAPSGLDEQLKNLFTAFSDQKNKKYKERFLTIHRNSLVPVLVSDIAFFRKEELIYLHTFSHERFLTEHQTMDEIESLVNPEMFFRVNRQYIVNISAVGKMRPTQKGVSISLKPPFAEEIDMSREKVTAFKTWLA